MGSIAENLTATRKAAGMSQVDLATASGVSQQLISQIERGSNLSTKHLPALARALGCAVSDLDEAYRFAGVDLLPAAGVAMSPDATPVLVSVYDLSASAGHGAFVGDYESIAYSLAFPPDYLRRITKSNPAHLAIISVKGDSMTPTLKDDDIVMVDTSKTSLGYDGLFVLRFHDALHVKRISRARPGFVTVISDNRAMYPEREFAESEVVVVGKVIWSGGKV
jgi:phage repressor protein C with HTH and peptisase S24 domain